MACKKALIWDDGLGFSGKALSSRCNYGCEFKRVFIREI